MEVDLGGIEVELGKLARHVGDIAQDSARGESKLAVFTGPSGSGFHPVLIALEPSDTVDEIVGALGRVATAFERIATTLEAGRVTHTE